ncbi:AraC-like ligand-binding domain-containing protein [Streptomyces sp. NEAU-174]|uniref:AraC-like ligand-binding domain-containing protein n=1 Tax=Streptomyces sp. NEAU-174 TaxID=3458254 RepID=UPI0040445ADE
MIETVFRCEDLPRADRFDFWRERMAQLMAPMEMTSDHTRDFRGEVRILEFGAASVWPTRFREMDFRRTPKLIRQSDPELYHFSFIQEGNLQVSQSRQEAAHNAEGLYAVDTSRPFACLAFGGPPAGVGLEIPKALIPVPHDRIDRLLARRLQPRLPRRVRDAAQRLPPSGACVPRAGRYPATPGAQGHAALRAAHGPCHVVGVGDGVGWRGGPICPTACRTVRGLSLTGSDRFLAPT